MRNVRTRCRNDSAHSSFAPPPYESRDAPRHADVPRVSPLTLKVRRLPGNDDVPLPARMSAHAAGLDVCAANREPVTLHIGDVVRIPCGFAMSLPPGWEAQVRPRSGLASRHGITLINSPGTIDADYRGEVQIPLVNHGSEPFTIERGMRIAQMVIQAVPAVEVVETDALDDTPRGTSGFGSSGV